MREFRGGPLRIAIVGAESSGKSTLARDLSLRLSEHTNLRCTTVTEHLRDWCERTGRTPLADEQPAIADAQAAAIEAAAARHDIVLCDTTPLMTAVYSELLFQDRSLHTKALHFQRSCALTLLTSLDLPWVADGLQRDGPQVQRPVDQLIRRLLLQEGLSWSLVQGHGEARIESALSAITPLLLSRHAAQGLGLFTRLQQRQQNLGDPAWICADCDDPDCERKSWHQRRAGGERGA